MKYRSRLLLCTAIAGCAYIGPVVAQQNAEAPVGLEEITVSARKTEERIIDVPLAVTAVTADQIADRGIVDIDGFAAITPGLTVQNLSVGRNDRGFRVYIIRGMIPGNGLATRASVSTFVDGALVFGGNLSALADVDHVETVKGPQSAYFGRGSFAGAINYVTRAPNMDSWGGKLSGDVGSHNYSNFSASIEGPLITDKLAVRVGASSYYQGAQYENPGVPGEGLGQRSTKSVSANLLFKPTDEITIKGYATIFHDSDGPNASASYLGPNAIQAGNSYNCNPSGGATNNYICGQLGPIPYTTRHQAALFPPTYFAQVQQGLGPNFPDTFPYLGKNFCTHVGLCREGIEGHLSAEYETQTGWNFNVNGSWDINHWAYPLAGDNNPFGLAYPNPQFGTAQDLAFQAQGLTPLLPYQASATLGNSADKDENFEARIASPDIGIFKGMVGVNYFHDYSDSQTPGYSATGPGATRHSSFVNHTYGLFGSVKADLSALVDGMSLTGEARHQWEEIWQTTRASNPLGSPYPVFDNHSTSFTPRIILEYKPDQQLTYYASYSVGSRPIEFNTNYFTLRPSEQAEIDTQVPVAGLVPADKIKMGEIGAKGMLFDNTVRFLVDGYYGQWTGRHVPNTVTYTQSNGQQGGLQVSTAGGIVDLWGIEAEATWQATRELVIDGTFNYAVTDVRYTFCNDCLSVAGNARPVGTQLPYYPKVTATLGATYTRYAFLDFDGFVNVEWMYRSRIFESEGNYAWTAPTNKFNAQIGLENEKYRVAFWGKNLTDNKTATSLSRSTYTTLNPNGTNNQVGLSSIAVSLPDKQAFGIRGSMKF